MKTSLRIFLFLLLFPILLPAQNRLHTGIYAEGLASLRIVYQSDDEYEATVNLQHPVLVLDDTERTFEISFDELTTEPHYFSYRLVHLNADRTPSTLQETEFVSGINRHSIDDYETSRTTQQPYTHYRFSFPNDDMKPKISGNYCVQIYEDHAPDLTLMQVCFYVVDPQVTVEATVRSQTDIELNGRYQQLDIDVLTKKLKLTDPQQLTVIVQQNNRWDNASILRKPTFIFSDKLQYRNENTLIFEGGNEYRHFDISSEYMKGWHVDRIDFDQTYYHAFLEQDLQRKEEPYQSEQDGNGIFRIHREKAFSSDTEADYMWVYFFLKADKPWLDGTIYITGDGWYNDFFEQNRMRYDEKHHCYYLSSYLKQGAYEYQYLFVPAFTKNYSTIKCEGSHWQTENDYTIYVYYRPLGARYDQLVALYSIKSI